ncbi:MAG: electron transport complex subunit RsxC [Synergistaceae bacterium]|nr:electron transport complex subunit RsxC [Synergistaceae bacterium]
MKLPTFLGGVHPPEGKALTADKAIETLLPKGDMVYPLSQHIGAPCAPVVAKGDRVLVGQKIADTDAFVSAPIFASVSGTVKEIGLRQTIPGSVDPCIVVENDGQYEKAPNLLEGLDHKPKPEDYVKLIRAAGIVGMGGACFPTHVKLSPPKGSVIRWIIVNAAECEPYLNCDNRLMLEQPETIVRGLELVLELFPEAQGVIAIEENKPKAIETMSAMVAKWKNPRIKVMPHKVKYPQGAEKMLIWSVTGQEIPVVPALPADVGCIILNTRTTWQIWLALTKGLPVTERIITVTGDAVSEPKNLQVPLGISVRELVEACGGFKEEPVKILAGGPMMGLAMRSLDVPVVKGTSGILCLTAKTAWLADESACIRCGRCVEACPMHLEPTLLDHLVRLRDYAGFEAHGGMNCIECGSCAYSCPASRHLVQSYKNGKAAVTAERRKAAAAAKAKAEQAQGTKEAKK